jgi:hypothetical protein
MRNTRVSYSFGEVNTYIQETQLPDTGNDPVKYSLDFVPISGGGGSSPITDYVPKSIGGTFDSLIGYTTDLTSSIISNNHITNKKYVDDAIAAALGGGAVIDYSLARPYFSSSAGTPLSYASATGIFTLNKNLSQYTNDIGFITDYTVTESDVTAHQAALTILASQIDGLDAAISTDFNTLFDARFGIKSIADLGTKSHLSLTNLPGSPEGFHLNVSAYTNVNRYATTSQDGILRAADWNTFNNKLDAINGDGTTITISGGNISVIPAGVDHDQLLNYVEAQHRVINDSGTANTDLWSASKIISYTSGYPIIYTIHLISAGTVAGRLVGLVAGTDYPTGWVLSADESALVITHGLDRRSKVVKVLSKNGTTSDCVELQGNVAYSTKTDVFGTGYDAIRLDAFATITTELYIEIIL